MSTDKIISILEEWSEVFGIKNFFLDALRQIGWWLCKGLALICDGCWQTVRQIYGLLGFANSEVMQKYVSDIHPLVVIFLTLALVSFGFYLFTRKNEAQINVLQSIIAIVLIMTVLPTLSAKVSKLTIASSDYVKEQYTEHANGSPSFALIDTNFVDLLKVDGLTKKDSFSSYSKVIENAGTGNNDKKNSLTSEKQIPLIQINEYMDYEKGNYDIVHEKLFTNKLTTDKDGKKALAECDDGFLDMFKDYYYRYHVNWGTLIFSLIAMTIALLFSALKSAKIVWEIGFHQIIGPFIAATDLASGQRVKEFVRSLISLFAALFIISAVMGIYFIGINYLASQSSKINLFTDIICKLALAWFVIDGPNVVEKIIGVDVGLKDAKGMMVGAWAAGRTASGVAKGIKNATVGSSFGRKGGNLGGIVGLGATVGKGLGKVVVGQNGVDAAKSKMDSMADKVSDAVKSATGGNGIAGAAINAGKAVGSAKEKMDAAKMGPNNLGGQGYNSSAKEANPKAKGASPIPPKGESQNIPGNNEAHEHNNAAASAINDNSGYEPTMPFVNMYEEEQHMKNQAEYKDMVNTIDTPTNIPSSGGSGRSMETNGHSPVSSNAQSVSTSKIEPNMPKDTTLKNKK